MGIMKALSLVPLIAGLATSVIVGEGPVDKRDDACSTGPGWAQPVQFIGGSESDGQQCVTQFGGDYTPVASMEVWQNGADDDRIAGVQFTFGSGKTTQIYGHEDTSKTPSSTFSIGPGITIKNCILYGNGKGEWLGHIHIETSDGKTFDAGRDTSGITPYGINVGSGLLLGAVLTPAPDGNTNSIANMAFLFLGAEIDHIQISDINFSEDPSGSASGIDPQNIVVGRWYNNQDQDVTYGLAPAYGVVSSYAYSQSVTLSFGAAVSVEVDAELFGIGAKTDTSFTWSVAEEQASTTATSSATSVTCIASGTLKPSSGVEVTGAYQTGKGSWSYNSKVTVFLKGGGSYNYSETGKLANTAYNECTTSWKALNSTVAANSPGLKAIANRRQRARGVQTTPAPVYKPL